ncbi:MAG: Pycsar system effector family protein [Saprospiraceae bacterium]
MSKDTNETAVEEAVNTELSDAARRYVRGVFHQRLAPAYLFHNFSYSTEVAEAAEELSDKSPSVTPELREQLLVAAYFLPLGYTETDEGAVARSAQMADAWLAEHDADEATRAGVRKLLQSATTDDEPPKGSDLVTRLFFDARNGWLGRKRYSRRAEALLLEKQYREDREIDPVEWEEEIEERIINLNFQTSAGNKAYEQRRRKNAAKQHGAIEKTQTNETKRKTGKNYGRGIDTMYRTAFRNHITLSRIADGKANMMISINTIILSILIAVSGAGLSFFEDIFFENPAFLLPIVILLLSSLTAVIFAVFSARPKVTEYRIKKRKLIEGKEASLLYFGNFLKLEKVDFVRYMADIKSDMEALYDDLSRDLYDLGAVLHRKYLLLTISYNTFVGGLFLSVVTFLAVYIFNLI